MQKCFEDLYKDPVYAALKQEEEEELRNRRQEVLREQAGGGGVGDQTAAQPVANDPVSRLRYKGKDP